MHIIEATKSDIPIIRLLADITFPHTYGPILTQEQITYMMEMMYSDQVLEQQMNDGHQFLLAKEEDQYLGYFSYQLNYEDKITKIHKIYMLPLAQGKGLGRLFIDEVTKIALANDNNILSLNVNRFNKAVDFYKHLDFVIADIIDLNIGDGYLMEDYVMKKYL